MWHLLSFHNKQDEIQYWQDIKRQILPIVRMITVFAIVVITFFMLEDWFVSREHFLVLFKAKVLSIICLLFMYYVMSTKLGKQYREINILMMISILIMLLSFQAELLQQTFMVPLIAILSTFISGTLIPWKISYHLCLIGICIISVLSNMFMMQEVAHFAISREAMHGIVFSFSSIFLALFSQQRRISLWYAERGLKENEERFRQLAEHSNDIVWIWSPSGKLLYVSPAFLWFTGRNAQDIYHQPYHILKIICPQYRTLFKETVQTIVQGRAKKIDLDIRHVNGTIFSFEAWGTPIKDDHGRVTRCVGNWRDVTERMTLITELRNFATTDYLTKAYNRRFFFEYAQKELKNLIKKQASLSLILFDIDHFKALNDTYGHQFGDEVLVGLSKIGLDMFREHDIFARFGGEEFVVLLSDTDKSNAMDIAERIRQKISAQGFNYHKEKVYISISLGVAHLPQVGLDANINDLISQADQAMYYSKEHGRNQVSCYDSDL